MKILGVFNMTFISCGGVHTGIFFPLRFHCSRLGRLYFRSSHLLFRVLTPRINHAGLYAYAWMLHALGK